MEFKQMKKMATIILACAAGAIAIQLMAPILLAIFVNVASLMFPFIGYHLFVQKGWRIHLEKEAKEEMPQEEEKEPDENHSSTQHWFHHKGQPMIEDMICDLSKHNVFECWIRRDGICNIRSETGYRRVRSIQGYPGNDVDTVADLLTNAGWTVMNKGRYLHITWEGR